jgi:hypothetical protein
MKIKHSDLIRNDYKIYLEPILSTACDHQAKIERCKTRSKYIRYAIIRALIQDGYPLKEISNKFDAFYKCSKINNYHKGITSLE